jgi:hypothetical protein
MESGPQYLSGCGESLAVTSSQAGYKEGNMGCVVRGAW